ncbi:hypothetical protein ACWHY4_13060 [Pseudomonas sp. E2-15]
MFKNQVKLKFTLTTAGSIQLSCVNLYDKIEVFERKVRGPVSDYTVTAELDGAVIFNVRAIDGSDLSVSETIGLTNESDFELFITSEAEVETDLKSRQKMDLVFGSGSEGYEIVMPEEYNNYL